MKTIVKVLIFILIAIILLSLILVIYAYESEKNNNTGESKCSKLDKNFNDGKKYTDWTSDDRNTVIWLINNQNKNYDINFLSGLSNAELQIYLRNYCGFDSSPVIDCTSLQPSFPTELSYDKWSTSDRNTVISLLNNQFGENNYIDFTLLSNQILYELSTLICGPLSDPQEKCGQISPQYTSTPYTKWNSDRRNNAIWLINNRNSKLTVADLQVLDNDVLQLLLNKYCN